MKKNQVREMYNQYHHLPKAEMLDKAFQHQAERINNIVFGSAFSVTALSFLSGATASAAASPDANPLSPLFVAAVGAGMLGGLGAAFKTEKIAGWINKIGGNRESLRDMLADRVSLQEGIPKDQVYSRTVALDDRDALVALAFEKHKAVVEGSHQTETDKSFRGSSNYRFVDAKFKAINIHAMDEVFFNNAYQTIENRYGRSPFIHEADEISVKNNLANALLLSENGKLSKNEINKLDSLSPTNHVSTYKSAQEDLDAGEPLERRFS